MLSPWKTAREPSNFCECCAETEPERIWSCPECAATTCNECQVKGACRGCKLNIAESNRLVSFAKAPNNPVVVKCAQTFSGKPCDRTATHVATNVIGPCCLRCMASAYGVLVFNTLTGENAKVLAGYLEKAVPAVRAI